MAPVPQDLRVQPPAELTGFVGRRAELREVRRGLSISRLVTLTGVGGVGKTRLAMRAASEMRRSFADGVCVVELAGLEDRGLVAQTIVNAVGIQDQYTHWTADTLGTRLSEQQLLLVLDNCEHLLDACTQLVATLLRQCPELRVLTTSRQPLGITGELVLRVPALRLPADDIARSAEALRGFDAIRLFEDRAAAAVPQFELDDQNGEAVSGLCRRLDGIPLAIELAAASLTLLSPAQLVQRLDDRFDLLTSGNQAALPRHQTLRASIDWSFQLCTEQEQILWARTSVFAESFDLEAAEAVCAGPGLPRREVHKAVAGLLQKSALIRDGRNEVVRYRLLETIRAYGREALRTAGAERELQKRHRDWYLSLAEDTARRWFGPAQVHHANRMWLEHPNIRAALDFCLATPGESHAGLRIADACRDIWRFNGLTSEGRRWFARLLERDTEASTYRARALASASYLALLQNDLAAADPMLDESRELAALDDLSGAGLYKVPEAFAAMLRLDYSSAVALLEQFVARHRDTSELNWLTTALVLLGTCYSLGDDRQQARVHWQESLDLCEQHGEIWRRAYMLWGLGFEAWYRGDWQNAWSFELKCLAAQQECRDQMSAAQCVETMSWISTRAGRHEEGARLAGTARALRTAFGGGRLPFFQIYDERYQEEMRRLIGEKAYTNAFEEGARMNFDQVADRLLGRKTTRPDSVHGGLDELLTKREREVANLVAQGMSNKQIAQSLVISRRTAETHIENILTKLGYTSRSQIAAAVVGDVRASPTAGPLKQARIEP